MVAVTERRLRNGGLLRNQCFGSGFARRHNFKLITVNIRIVIMLPSHSNPTALSSTRDSAQLFASNLKYSSLYSHAWE